MFIYLDNNLVGIISMYLNQYDLSALTLTCKNFHESFITMLENIKAWLDRKCQILMIHDDFIHITDHYIYVNKQPIQTHKFINSADECGFKYNIDEKSLLLTHTAYNLIDEKIIELLNDFLAKHVKLDEGDIIIFESIHDCKSNKFICVNNGISKLSGYPSLNIIKYPPKYWSKANFADSYIQEPSEVQYAEFRIKF